MKHTFERSALALVGVLVGGLVGAVYLDPPLGDTRAPRAVLRIAPSALVPESQRDLELDLETAARAEGPAAAREHSTETVAETFRAAGYSYETLLSGEGQVPRIFLASVPDDLDQLRQVEHRKALFIEAVLPLVLQVNEEIRAARARLWDLRARKRLGEQLDAVDRLWLATMSERYGVARGDLESLLARVDIVPPSLALAQAAAESGWGTSRFAREGNALFGQWTTADGPGLTPLERERGLTHKVRAFDSLLESVRAYALNLNTHTAYRGFRKARLKMRRHGKPLDGSRLAGELEAYSERGLEYVGILRTIIDANRLSQLDAARLSDDTEAAGGPEPVRGTDA